MSIIVRESIRMCWLVPAPREEENLKGGEPSFQHQPQIVIFNRENGFELQQQLLIQQHIFQIKEVFCLLYLSAQYMLIHVPKIAQEIA